MRVEIIEDKNYKRLEEKINIILKYVQPSEILDIKYSGSGNSSAYSIDYYSAMIIYK